MTCASSVAVCGPVPGDNPERPACRYRDERRRPRWTAAPGHPASATQTGHRAARPAQIILSGHQPDSRAAGRAAVHAAQRTLSRMPATLSVMRRSCLGELPGGADEVSAQARAYLTAG